MPEEINSEWWKDYFDETYLITDARSVCDEEITKREVDCIEKILKLKSDASILDLCGGQGRHAIELGRRRYRTLSVLDYSEYLLDLGRKKAAEENLDIRFLKADARRTDLDAESFDVILVMANSFGYFPDDEQNLSLLSEIRRLLKKRGAALLDLVDPAYMKKNFAESSWHEANDDVIVVRKRSIQGGTIFAREIVLSKAKGLLRDGRYCERLYTPRKIKKLAKRAGFAKVTVKRGFRSHMKTGDFGFLNSRNLVVLKK